VRGGQASQPATMFLVLLGCGSSSTSDPKHETEVSGIRPDHSYLATSPAPSRSSLVSSPPNAAS
jgi:hypothetical protein